VHRTKPPRVSQRTPRAGTCERDHKETLRWSVRCISGWIREFMLELHAKDLCQCGRRHHGKPCERRQESNYAPKPVCPAPRYAPRFPRSKAAARLNRVRVDVMVARERGHMHVSANIGDGATRSRSWRGLALDFGFDVTRYRLPEGRKRQRLTASPCVSRLAIRAHACNETCIHC
jgi:hypothetical protein